MAAPATRVIAQDAGEWDRNRAELVAQRPGPMAAQISRWEKLWEGRQAQRPFNDYASFLLANPGFPDETTLRARAEQRLREEFVDPATLLRFFENQNPCHQLCQGALRPGIDGSGSRRGTALGAAMHGAAAR